MTIRGDDLSLEASVIVESDEPAGLERLLRHCSRSDQLTFIRRANAVSEGLALQSYLNGAAEL